MWYTDTKLNENKIKIFRDFSLHWWQISIFKLTLTAFGILIGSYWHEFFSQYCYLILVLFVVGIIYLTLLWFQKQHGK